MEEFLDFDIPEADAWMIPLRTPLDDFTKECSGVFIDIGAHVGLVACRAFLKGFNPVYAFEADKENFDRLCQNIARVGGVGSIHAFNRAISDTTGTEVTLRQMKSDGSASGQKSIFFRSENFSESCRVMSLSLLDVLEWDSEISFLKCDIEGGEFSIFTPTILKILSEKVKYLSVELHPPHMRAYFDAPAFEEMYVPERYSSIGSAGKELILRLNKEGFEDMIFEEVMSTEYFQFHSHNTLKETK